MTRVGPRHAAFDRHPPAGLEDAPLSEVLRSMAVTASVFEAFSWRPRSLGRWRRFVWDAPGVGDGVSHATGDTSDSGACCVCLELFDENGVADTLLVDNDLELFLVLLRLSRKDISRVDDDLFEEAVKNLVLAAAGYDPAMMPVEVFAALVDHEPLTGEVAA